MSLIVKKQETEARLVTLTCDLISKLAERAEARGVSIDEIVSDAVMTCARTPEAPSGPRDALRVILTPEATRRLAMATNESAIVAAALALAFSPSAPIARLVPPPAPSPPSRSKLGWIRPHLPKERLAPVLAALDARRVTLVEALGEGLRTFSPRSIEKATTGNPVFVKGVPATTLKALDALREQHAAAMSGVVLAVLEHWLKEATHMQRRSRR